jgi:hypothetical protein
MSEGEAESNLLLHEGGWLEEHGIRPMSKKSAQAEGNKRMKHDIEAVPSDIQIHC